MRASTLKPASPQTYKHSTGVFTALGKPATLGGRDVPSRINAGTRVPVTFLMAEDFEPCARFGDRTLSRYRSMARKALGETSPVLAPPPDDPVREVLQEMLDEVERVQWMLRLSPRLRERYGD